MTPRSQEELIKEAEFCCGNCDDGSLRPEDAFWCEGSVPSSVFFSLMDGGESAWSVWLTQEIAMWEEDHGYPSHWSGFLEAPDLIAHLEETTDGPCVVSLGEDGRLQIWDGWHRVAAHIARGEQSISVLLGVRIGFENLLDDLMCVPSSQTVHAVPCP